MDKAYKIPISSIAGNNVFNLRKQAKKHKVEKKHRVMFYKSFAVSAIMTLLSVIDKIRYAYLKKHFKKEITPIFIIGHWRSGTTLLHNLMCKDSKAGYTTTYQTLFPNNLFGLQGIIKKILLMFMPKERPYDHVPIHPDFPQEEEFALANTFSQSYYNWFYFPNKRKEIFKNLKFWETLSEGKKNSWLKTYDDLVKRSLINTNKLRYISKNPPNTFRIPQLLKLYPNAKFIYIFRNPYEVYSSSFNFFKSTLSAISFQSISDSELKKHILTVYREMIDTYEKDKNLLKEKNLIEVRYEDFVKSPVSHLEQIYKHFDLEADDNLRKLWNEEEQNAKCHKINKNVFDNETIAETNNFLQDFINSKEYLLLKEKKI